MWERAACFALFSLVTGCGGTVVETAAENDHGSDAGSFPRLADLEAGTDAALRSKSPRVADAGWTCGSSYRCPGPTSAVNATGTLRGRPIFVNRVALEYESGFTNSTLLSFQAVWGAEPATILVTLRSFSDGIPEAQVPPGVYGSPGDASSSAAYVSVATCAEVVDLAGVAIDISEHTGRGLAGAPVRLRGEFRTVDAPESSLSIPFDIDAVCALHNSP